MANKKVRHVKGLGSVYYDNTKQVWIGQVENGKYSNGRVKYKRFLNSSQDEVIYKMKEFVNQGTLVNSTNTNNVKNNIQFKDFLNSYLNNVKKNKLKPASYDRDSTTANNNIVPYIGGYDLSELTTSIIQLQLVNRLQETNYSFSTINKAYVLTNECLKYACYQGLIEKNPCEFVAKPSKTSISRPIKEIRFFDDDEINAFKEVALSKYKNGRFKYSNGYAFIILIYTGLRIGELLALKWKDIDLNNKFIKVHSNIAVTHKNNERQVLIQDSTKTRKSRIVYLTGSAIYYITQLKENTKPHNDDFVITTNGKREVSAVRNSYLGICKRANIDDPQGLHTLRHTFASLMIRKGVDIKIISEMLGHSSVSFTYNTYVHLLEEEKAKVIAQIDI